MIFLPVTSMFFLVLSINILHVTALPTAQIKNGTLEGSSIKTRKGREVSAFKGIPYALPPVGELRFERPQPAKSWTDIRPAKNDAAACLQNGMFAHEDEAHGKEDCLYLNVYTPRITNSKNENLESNYPVMVWIHGGGWVMGSSHSSVYAPTFLLDHDVVLVTLNYRLGALGFLSTGDDVIPGNYGLKDQAQALRWIHENIAAFGGDPNQVTIFGWSAGAASTHYLMLSPLTKGLIHRVISQSGNAWAPWALTRPETARSQAHRLAEQLNCPIRSSEELRDCLRSRDAADIMVADQGWLIFDSEPMIAFKPVVECNHSSAFITGYPADIVRAAHLVDIPWMTGITAHDGSLKTASFYGHEERNLVRKLNVDFLDLAPMSMFYDVNCPKHMWNKVSTEIRKFYFGDKAIDESTRFSLIDMYTDSFFAVSMDRAIKDHLRSLESPIYCYYFAYRGSFTWTPIFGDSKRDHGVSHGDELFYLYPLNEGLFSNTSLSNEDEKMIDIITTLWYNFAKTGNPTPEISSQPSVQWKPVRTKEIEYLSIENSREMKMSKNLLKERMQFWENLPCKAGFFATIERTHVKNEL